MCLDLDAGQFCSQATAALECASNGGNTFGLRGKSAYPVRVVAPNGVDVLKGYPSSLSLYIYIYIYG